MADFSNDTIKAKSWQKNLPPRRILAIRLQAMGDVAITLPYLQHLRNNLPEDTIIDFLTREEVEDIPKSIDLFNDVYSIRGGRNEKKQLLYAASLLPKLLSKRYNVVIDLQNNRVSNFVRKILQPVAWSSFDRFSARPAGERTQLTIEAAGLTNCSADHHFIFNTIDSTDILLKANGWDGVSDLIVLNPAGAFESRHWPPDHYVQFVSLWLNHFPATQFMILGTSFIEKRSSCLKKKLNGHLVDLVGKTTPAQAFALLQKAKIILSEDSGLMHMAWVSGISTIAIFGSTRSDWARPLGDHTFFFDSSDLECGNCMKQICKYGDTRCLTRISPEMVFEKATILCRNTKQNHNSFSTLIY